MSDDAGTCDTCQEEYRECDCEPYQDDDQRLGGYDNLYDGEAE